MSQPDELPGLDQDLACGTPYLVTEDGPWYTEEVRGDRADPVTDVA